MTVKHYLKEDSKVSEVCHASLQVASPSRKATTAAAPVLQRWPEEKLSGLRRMNCIPREEVRANCGKSVVVSILRDYQAWISLLPYQFSTMLFFTDTDSVIACLELFNFF